MGNKKWFGRGTLEGYRPRATSHAHKKGIPLFFVRYGNSTRHIEGVHRAVVFSKYTRYMLCVCEYPGQSRGRAAARSRATNFPGHETQHEFKSAKRVSLSG